MGLHVHRQYTSEYQFPGREGNNNEAISMALARDMVSGSVNQYAGLDGTEPAVSVF